MLKLTFAFTSAVTEAANDQRLPVLGDAPLRQSQLEAFGSISSDDLGGLPLFKHQRHLDRVNDEAMMFPDDSSKHFLTY